MADEVIGGVSISVSGDFSDLDKSFDEAVSRAVAEGKTLADAIQSALSSPDVSGVSDAFAKAGDAATAATGQVQELGTATQQAGQQAQESSAGFGDLAGEILKLAGITLSIDALVNLGKAAIDASDRIDDATYAISRFTGDIGTAKDVVEGLKAVAQDEGLSFPQLLTAGQHMEALLPAGSDVVGIMKELGNSSELMGKSLETVANKFDLIVESGKISAKSLKDLGITFDDIKAAMENMGASAEVMSQGTQKAFASITDQQERIDVMTEALHKLDGAAKDMNDDIKGDVTRTMNEFYIAIAKLGDAIGPLARDVLPGLVAALKGIVVAGDFVVTGLKLVIDAVIGVEATIAAATFGIGQAIAKTLSGDFSGAATAIKSAIADINSAVKNMGTEMAADIKSGTDFMNKVWSVDMPAALDKTKTAAKDTSGELSDLSTKGKTAAQDISSAFASIDSLEAKISSGAGVQALQAAFENTSKAIQMVAKVDLPAAIKAVDDYTQAQIRNGASASVIMAAFETESKLIGQLAKVDLPSAITAMDNLVGSLSKAKEPLGIIQAAFEQEEKMIQQLAKQDLAAASAAWDKLIQTLQNANAPLSVMNQALKDHTKFLEDNAAAAEKAVIALDKAAISYSNFNTKGSDAARVMTDANAALENLGVMATRAVTPMSDLNKAMIDAGASTAKAKNAFEDLHTPITTITNDMDLLIKQAQKSGDWTPVLTALDEFDKRIQNLSKTDLPAAEDQLAQFVQGMIKMGAPAELIQGQIEKLQQIVQKMASEGLPQAGKGWADLTSILAKVPPAIKDIQDAQEQQIASDQRLLDLMQQRGDKIGYIYDQEAKLLQEEITSAEKAGDAAGQEVLALEGVRLKTEELKLASHGYADEMVAGIQDLLKGFDSLAGSMSDAIVNGKNLGDALVGSFKKIGQSLLTDVIQAGLVPLKQGIIEVVGQLLPSLNLGLKVSGESAKALSEAMAAQKSVIDAVVAADTAATAAKTANTGATTASTTATVADTSADIADASATIADTGATIADTGATIADTAATVVDTAATVAESAADIADTIATVADTAATIAETAATIAATAAQIAFATTVGAVAGIIGAVAGIVGDVYLATISHDTGKIENNTRATLAQVTNIWSDLKSDFVQSYDRMGELLDRLNHIMDSTAQIAAQGPGGSAGGMSADAINKIAGDGDNTVKILANIYDLTQGILKADQTTANDIPWIVTDADNIWHTLGEISATLTEMYDVLLYGKSFGQSSEASASSQRAMQTSALNALVGHSIQHGNALGSLVTQSITGNGQGRQIVDNTGATASDAAALYAPILAQANAAADALRHAGNTEAQLSALRAEEAAYAKLANQAHMQGDEALAQSYQVTANNLASQISAITHVGTAALVSALGATDMSLVDASKGVQFSTLAGAQLISTTVAQGSMLVATSVSNALSSTAAASASFMASMASSLINIKGSNSSAGPLPSQQISLNSQGAPASPSVRPPDNGLPPIPVTGHMGYATGGSIETDQVAQLHAGEVVLPATQVAASAAQMTAQAQQIADLQAQLAGLNQGLMGSLANGNLGDSAEAQKEINVVQSKLDALTAATDANTAATQAASATSGASGSGQDPAALQAQMVALMQQQLAAQNELAVAQKTGNAAIVQVSQDKLDQINGQMAALKDQQVLATAAQQASKSTAAAGSTDTSSASDILARQLAQSQASGNDAMIALMQDKLNTAAPTASASLGSTDPNTGLFIPPSPDAYKSSSLANEALNTSDVSSPDLSGFDFSSLSSGGGGSMDTSGIIAAIQEGTAMLDADLHQVSVEIMALAAHVGGAGLVSSIAGAQKWGVATPKSFDVGGFVDQDQMAMVHAGEYVVPPDITGMLRSMASAPHAGYGVDPSAGGGSNGGGGVVVHAPINITGVTDGRQLAVMLEQHLKRVLSRTGKYTK